MSREPIHAPRRFTSCGEPDEQGRGRCPRAREPGFNPLGFCADHLAAYRERIGNPTPIGEEPRIDITPHSWSTA